MGESLSAGLGGKVYSVEADAVREGTPGPVLLLRSERAVGGDPELVSSGLSRALDVRGPALVLVGSTKFGRMVAARLAVIGRTGVLSDVRDLRLEGDRLTGTRGVYAGKFSAGVSCPVPCIALVPQGAYSAATGPSGPVENVETSAGPLRVTRSELKATPKSTLDLRGAKVIVAAGRGFKTKEDLAMVQRLADALGGSMGASRPLSSDLGWLGEEHHIGLTGVYVHPDLYLAIGISGQLQHVAGIRDSKIIAAINKDRQAPIFQVADYGIVGDLYEVLPALLRALGR